MAPASSRRGQTCRLEAGTTVSGVCYADADREALEAIWQQTIKTSPVGNSLSRPAPITPELLVVA